MADKFCPACKNRNGAEATFCIYCGAALEYRGNPSTTPQRMDTDLTFLSQVIEKAFVDTLEVPERGVALYLSDNVKAICIMDEDEFILGRKVGGEGKEKLVDLAPHEGYEMGVSKQHAKIHKTPDGYEIVDLGSTNGTWLNKQRLIPNRSYLLYSGAYICLGRLCLYVIYKKVE
jgi:hypothetical protein